ncbi:tRNA (guanine-N(7)-)-methyltransferase non-catalytic subunit trm82 [Penicillium canariense]|uniref:tRNA (Guanine-N(7)-)-methyltransferase non-catalytic subunit trm82 n=1 Tax=Penicillium canariense TaxID=189055 RepID=A0A9W9LIA4_9EURO|nr:tRNA (guanine-N(7)-)-methyltransferase non-catalytic subunit trm82 [Penicillium canariense]KAJ5157033.1 tRNA (guanine-N(7)-)-methyltransferase non-catalytic subunit trm82 [Penicillium canariense]
MASFQHPFRSLKYVKRQHQGLSDVLIASAGRHIYCYEAESGRRLDVWPQHVEISSKVASGPKSTSEDQAPPEKRRKLSSPETQAEEKPTEEILNSKSPSWTNIPMVLASPDGKYVVALTAEDKCIRVFSLSEDGKLQELSSRNMPKKPCALDLTPDGQTILCADKFGDVYSLPLIPGEYVKTRAQVKASKPAATTLTVHSKRNLLSLEQQLRQAERAEKAEKAEGVEKPQEEVEEKNMLNFEHQLILGHVSMLTDLISVSLPGPSGSRPRNYILTADRDEHIRVSRGIPQAHVIEQQCLGHTSLVSKICVPSWAPNVLISGGGDGLLLVWNWSEGELLQKILLGDSFQDSVVSGIWDISLDQPVGTRDPVRAIFVNLEGSSQLLHYSLESDSTLTLQDTIQLSGNVLDLVSMDLPGSVVVSVDTVREPNCTDTWKSGPASPQILLESLRANSFEGSLKWSVAEDSKLAIINAAGTSDLSTTLEAKARKAIDDALYNLGNTRKKSYGD